LKEQSNGKDPADDLREILQLLMRSILIVVISIGFFDVLQRSKFG
jgi:hypothetical protein